MRLSRARVVIVVACLVAATAVVVTAAQSSVERRDPQPSFYATAPADAYNRVRGGSRAPNAASEMHPWSRDRVRGMRVDYAFDAETEMQQHDLEFLMAHENDSFVHVTASKQLRSDEFAHRRSNERGDTMELEDPAVIPWGSAQDTGPSGSTYRARRYVIVNLDKDKSNFMLYPYDFDLETKLDNGTEVDASFPDGAFIDTEPQEVLPTADETSYFFYYLKTQSVDLKRSKAIYDSNIAVLQVSGDWIDGVDIDLTWESDYYCTMFYNYIWGKYTKCFRNMYQWQTYLDAYPTDHEPVSIVFLTPGNITAGALRTSDGRNRFGMLILPDIVEDSQDDIYATLGATGSSEITSFIQRGGLLYSSSKAAMVAEKIGLVQSGTFDPQYTLTSTSSVIALANGCVDYDDDDKDTEFVHRTLCFSPPRGTNVVYNALLSGPYMVSKDSSYTVYAKWRTDVSWRPLMLHEILTGLNSELPDDVGDLPMMMYKKLGLGHVVLNLGNSAYDYTAFPWVYNAYLLANSKSLVLNSQIEGGLDRVIPALETVALGVSMELKNVYTEDISSAVTITVWHRNGVTATATSDGCKLVNSNNAAPIGEFDSTSYFDCSLSSLKALSSKKWTFNVEITNITITQQKIDIALLYPQVVYTDTGKSETIGYPVTVDAAMAALLRADMNIDPSSMYPLHGRGSYVDNVMNCENKEETKATGVSHVSIVPLISPMIDINDQVYLARYVEFDAQYYKKAVNNIADYIYPFSSEDQYDYMDFTRQYHRGNMLAASWDEAVKIFRTARDTVTGAGDAEGVNIASILNANYQTHNDNDFFLLKQKNFQDSDSYYEHATQRLMAFLDTWESTAAKTYYGGSIPSSEQSVTNPSVSKFKILFARHDIFFWTKYPQPEGLPDHNTVISLDRYPNAPCTGTGTQTSKAAVAGVFSYKDSRGLVPVQWQNELLLDCNRKKLDPANVKSISGGTATLTHYVVPITDPSIQSAGDLYGFSGNTYTTYPEVTFETLYQCTVDVDPADSRKGGEMVFTFSTDAWTSDPSANEYITVASDQIAVIKTWYTNRQLHIRFKRGNMPNEAYGSASHLQVNLESTTFTAASISTSLDVYSLVYDVGDPADNYERWYDKHTVSGQAVTFKLLRALRMPALRLNFTLATNGSTISPYQFLEPFVRYGIYEQELLLHRAVHGSSEIHPISEPCLVTRNSGFSTITHVGISSVPFREYVNTGLSLLIPAAPETGRIEWTDLWGRHWAQPVRSTIFEYPPIPPPLRNFVMTTTFEVLNKTGKIQTDWRSDDSLDVHVQMKLLNNYPKWFEITSCKGNEVVQLCSGGKNCAYSRLFDTDWQNPDFEVPSDKSDGNQYIKIGHNASYGICFRDAEVYLSGEHLTASQRQTIQYADHCAEIVDDEDPNCENLHGLPTVTHRPTNNTDDPYNFAQQVKEYWPDNYVLDIMWDLTHYDYDDNKFDKAYKYHMDNNLPHLGASIPKTDNMIAFPLFKGLGYTMTYSATHEYSNFHNKKGWWSDNLQNRDRTLIAGQSSSNTYSVGKSSLIPDSQWTDITSLQGASTEAQAALKNIYTCLFNRKWLQVPPNNKRVHYLTNVYENNVVPVPPTLTNDMVTNYDCSNSTQYTPNTISQFPNVVYTDSSRDWLYFAANLRGNALETINVLYQLKPLDSDKLKFEGIAKIQDGGRFTYWNPANSRNSWLVVDNAVSTIMAIRNDIEAEVEIIPTYATTFDTSFYQHITITDPEEEKREWTSSIYIKHHGYGDFAVSVYVGDSGSAILNPGSTSRVKYTFSNNAGFDINLKANAIESDEIEDKAINSNDLLFNLKHTLKYPKKYNFMNVSVPKELAPYITIVPDQNVVGIAPLFFDFDNINVATIRDGWKGDYYYDITLSANFPDSLRGRLYTLPATLNREYFEYFPGAGDPTGTHSYVVEMPPIVFGVPYSSSSIYAGKIFYTSGYATNLRFKHLIPSSLSPAGAYFVTVDQLDVLRQCLSTEGEYNCMDTFWANLGATGTPCKYQVTAPNANQWAIDYGEGVRSYAPTFPKKVDPVNGPDQSELDILLRIVAPQLEAGYPVVSQSITTTFNDWAGFEKTYADNLAYDVHSKGAWLSVGYNGVLCSETGLPLNSQILKPEDSGTVSLTVTLRNSGDGMAYNVNMSLVVPNNITIMRSSLQGLPATVLDSEDGQTYKITLEPAVPLSPGSSLAYKLLFEYQPDNRDGAGADSSSPLNTRTLCLGAVGNIDLTETPQERTVSQNISTPFKIAYSDADRPAYHVYLTGEKKSSHKAKLHVDFDVQEVRNVMWRYRAPDTEWITFAYGSDLTKVTVDVKEQWHNITHTYHTKYDRPTIDYMVSLTRTAYVSYTSAPVILCESNVWQWHEATGNMLLLLILIPGILLPLLGLLFFFVKYPGREHDLPLLAAEAGESPVYTASSSLSSSPSFSPTMAPAAAAAPSATHKSSPSGGFFKKARRFVPGAKPEPEPVPQDQAGPTYLIAGVHPVNVKDSRNVDAGAN
eukprot:TRINITY_DN44_c0_g2_i1.p1 TRINITY_DN44_c0_g2~~TRINITY_DN44_c0_g2_i1.p1  ORF type:complete len:2522 (-),score=650.58 TRINITY_DN44_c0_g2_i1:100-7614(-)